MKKTLALLMSIVMCLAIFAACKNDEPVDYSKYAFTEIWWTRDADNDEEKIHFGADGSFSYSCACGDPVNDSDVCEGYKYDDETKTITLECIEEIDGMITVIKIVKCEGDELHLDFDGDIRIFTTLAR